MVAFPETTNASTRVVKLLEGLAESSSLNFGMLLQAPDVVRCNYLELAFHFLCRC
jgi:hypothetical protein